MNHGPSEESASSCQFRNCQGKMVKQKEKTMFIVWFGLVWFGLVWFGLVWFGLILRLLQHRKPVFEAG